VADRDTGREPRPESTPYRVHPLPAGPLDPPLASGPAFTPP